MQRNLFFEGAGVPPMHVFTLNLMYYIASDTCLQSLAELFIIMRRLRDDEKVLIVEKQTEE